MSPSSTIGTTGEKENLANQVRFNIPNLAFDRQQGPQRKPLKVQKDCRKEKRILEGKGKKRKRLQIRRAFAPINEASAKVNWRKGAKPGE